MKHATQESVKDDELKRREHKHYAVKKDAELGGRDAEDMRILAVRDDVTTREILDITEERRTARLMLGEVRRVGETGKSEEQYKYDPPSLHPSRIRALRAICNCDSSS